MRKRIFVFCIMFIILLFSNNVYAAMPQWTEFPYAIASFGIKGNETPHVFFRNSSEIYKEACYEGDNVFRARPPAVINVGQEGSVSITMTSGNFHYSTVKKKDNTIKVKTVKRKTIQGNEVVSIPIEGVKSGETYITITCNKDAKLRIPINVVDTELGDDWKTVPANNASPYEIKRFVLSDADRTPDSDKGKAMTDLSKTTEGINKIKNWRRIIYNQISKSPAQYGQAAEYGRTRDLLDAIIKAYQDNESADDETRNSAIEDAIREHLDELEEAAEEENRQLHFILEDLIGDRNEERTSRTFEDVFEHTPNYSNVGGIETEDANKVKTMIGKILGVITNIGIVISVIVPAIIGIKYILSSPEGKAEYKKDMIPYMVGVLLLFSVCSVVKIVQVLGVSINNQ